MSVFNIFSSKVSHPLVEPREIKRICADLVAREPLSALEEATVWLEALIEFDDIKLMLRLERLMQIDAAATPQARRLARQYLSRMTTAEAQRATESSLWDAGYAYWSKLADAYASCLSRFDSPGIDSESKKVVKANLLPIYARLMHAHAERRKWDLYHYKPASPEFWAAVGEVYWRAVASKLESREIELYPNQGISTIELEYLKVLLLHSSSPDKLGLVEIELASRLLSHFLMWFIFTKELRRDNMYWVDITKPLPPTRMAKTPEPSATLRFFSGGGALVAIDEMIDVIKRDKRVPANVMLGAQYDANTVTRVLEHLSRYWSPTPPTRSHARRPVKSKLRVAHGLASSRRHITGDSAGANGIYRWEADDVSLGGMSARICEGQQEWVSIGVLLAVQAEGGNNWVAGVVRRYVRTDARQGSVGIQTISLSPRGVIADAGGIQTEALLLDLPVVGEYARMALPPAALEDKVALQFALDDKNARLHPREILESGPGYVVANFFVQSFS